MINSFSQYLVEEERVVYFTFGRMNPPTIGHGKLLDMLASKAKRNPYRIYLSQSQDSRKNPLSYSDKVKHVRKMFPKHARSVMINKKVRTAIEALVALYDEGFRKIVMVVGSDRINEFDILLNKYNGKTARHGFYNFKSIDVISAGARDPDSEGVEGMSASKQRENASKNDFTSFAQGLPKNLSNNDARRLFNAVRKGMGLKEQNEFKRHIQLKTLSETREAFIKGELFELGETVVISKTGEIGKVEIIGSNYVIVEANGKRTRQWLDSISHLDEEYKYEEGTPEAGKHARKMTPGQSEGNGLWANIHNKRRRGEKMRKKGEKGAPTPDQIKRAQEQRTPQDKDIADRPGTQPSKYHKGLSKATKAVRDRQFKKQTKMADNDPAAYKDAPGDKAARKKGMPISKNTAFVRKMMGEDNEHEITVGDYTTTHFHMCGSAIKAMKKHANVKGAELITRLQDKYYKFEKQFLNKEPTAQDKAKAQKMYDEIMAKSKAAGIEKDVKPYMDEHLSAITKGDPKPGFGRTDITEKVNLAKAKDRISREKEMDKQKHDRMMDRARLKDTRSKNMQTEASFADKSKKSGISVGTLKKVYSRGVAAWKTGHRPGTTPSQWGHARVNAFIRKKKQGGLNHDKDLA